MYIIIIIDPLSQPGVYDIVKEPTIESIVQTLKNIIKKKLDNDPDFVKVNFNRQIINENYKKYCDFIDENISSICYDNTPKFSIKYLECH